MLHWKVEGSRIRQGLNVYHPKDQSSAGFVLRIGNHILRFRWSKIVKKFFGGYDKVNPITYNKEFGDWNK